MGLHCSTDRHIAAPPEALWALVSDLDRWAGTISAIRRVEKLTDGPLGPGTRFRETRVMFGREATEVMTVDDFQPPHRMTFLAESHGSKYFSEIRFEPDAGGTRATIAFRAEPQSVGAKVMGVLMGPMMKGSIIKAFDADLADMQRAVEEGAAQPAPTPAV